MPDRRFHAAIQAAPGTAFWSSRALFVATPEDFADQIMDIELFADQPADGSTIKVSQHPLRHGGHHDHPAQQFLSRFLQVGYHIETVHAGSMTSRMTAP